MKKIKAFGICLYKTFNPDHVEILLCKSVNSNTKWGFLKGVQKNGETDIQTAIREFREESTININQYFLEQYFEQHNKSKDIGIWIVNSININSYNNYFTNNSLKKECLSSENSQVSFFDINNLPVIKKKQKYLIHQIVDHFKYERRYS
ncbi:MAG: NUDIX hydrolase [Deltaproteobacteria bacterium]|nr:MAG: NUDIX hydrolase [Deltaproteobacteria bacterium]